MTLKPPLKWAGGKRWLSEDRAMLESDPSAGVGEYTEETKFLALPFLSSLIPFLRDFITR